jgi:hypothetical protein
MSDLFVHVFFAPPPRPNKKLPTYINIANQTDRATTHRHDTRQHDPSAIRIRATHRERNTDTDNTPTEAAGPMAHPNPLHTHTHTHS